MDQRIVNGSTLLGTALTMFGVGTIVPLYWQKIVMFGGCYVFIIFSTEAFFEKKDITL